MINNYAISLPGKCVWIAIANVVQKQATYQSFNEPLLLPLHRSVFPGSLFFY
jgi:hypothetical protein